MDSNVGMAPVTIILFSDEQMKRMEETLNMINDQNSKSLKRKIDPRKVSDQYSVFFSWNCFKLKC